MSLGLFSALRSKHMKTAYFKPVGQEVVHVGANSVDKDSYLFSEVFHMEKKVLQMSPVTVGRGYTQKYIFNPNRERNEKKIMDDVKVRDELIPGEEKEEVAKSR